jgi:hypothetical protein
MDELDTMNKKMIAIHLCELSLDLHMLLQHRPMAVDVRSKA